MADEIDAAQERGEVARADAGGANIPNGVRTADTVPATYDELGVTRQRVAEWRKRSSAAAVSGGQLRPGNPSFKLVEITL